MREAQKMMQDPEFQRQMKQMMAAPGFQQAIQKTQAVINDPTQLKELEEKAQKQLDEGNKQLEEIEKFRKEREADKGSGGDADKTVDGEDEVPDIPNLSLN